jgi:hypothetical protein
VRGMHQPVQDAICRQRLQNPKTGRRGHSASRLPAHRFDESPDDYSLAGCSPAEPASASPSDYQLAIDRPTEPLLTIKRRVCILRRVSPTGGSPCKTSGFMHKNAQLTTGIHRSTRTSFFRASLFACIRGPMFLLFPNAQTKPL